MKCFLIQSLNGQSLRINEPYSGIVWYTNEPAIVSWSFSSHGEKVSKLEISLMNGDSYAASHVAYINRNADPYDGEYAFYVSNRLSTRSDYFVCVKAIDRHGQVLATSYGSRFSILSTGKDGSSSSSSVSYSSKKSKSKHSSWKKDLKYLKEYLEDHESYKHVMEVYDEQLGHDISKFVKQLRKKGY